MITTGPRKGPSVHIRPYLFPDSQLFSDPGKKGTLFGEGHFRGATEEKSGKRQIFGGTEELRTPRGEGFLFKGVANFLTKGGNKTPVRTSAPQPTSVPIPFSRTLSCSVTLEKMEPFLGKAIFVGPPKQKRGKRQRIGATEPLKKEKGKRKR